MREGYEAYMKRKDREMKAINKRKLAIEADSHYWRVLAQRNANLSTV